MWQDKKREEKGFTLIEVLIVMLIISLTVGIVAPVAYKSVSKFRHIITQKDNIDLEREADYLSFIKDEPCKVEQGKIVCGKRTYASLKDVFK